MYVACVHALAWSRRERSLPEAVGPEEGAAEP